MSEASSASSRFSASSSASALAASTNTCAALNADATSVISSEIFKIAWRRVRASSLFAKCLARPMWPCEARAAKLAIAEENFSSSSNAATAATEGVRKTRLRVLERIVGRTSLALGAQSNQTVLRPGSSIAFKSAFAADSVSRSASSITTTR